MWLGTRTECESTELPTSYLTFMVFENLSYP